MCCKKPDATKDWDGDKIKKRTTAKELKPLDTDKPAWPDTELLWRVPDELVPRVGMHFVLSGDKTRRNKPSVRIASTIVATVSLLGMSANPFENERGLNYEDDGVTNRKVGEAKGRSGDRHKRGVEDWSERNPTHAACHSLDQSDQP
ncbi:hypothetical protein E4U19_007285, partial [Claviceps sp. Clav32 group G5]